jgi:hypothetical protein
VVGGFTDRFPSERRSISSTLQPKRACTKRLLVNVWGVSAWVVWSMLTAMQTHSVKNFRSISASTSSCAPNITCYTLHRYKYGRVSFIKGNMMDGTAFSIGLKYHDFSGIFDSMTAARSASGKIQAPPTLTSGKATSEYKLPASSEPGVIPVNAQNERLDTYREPATTKQLARLKSQTKFKKLCAAHSLRGTCELGNKCNSVQKATGNDARVALRCFVKTKSCFRGSGCRIEDCSAGHLCQNNACKDGIPDDKCRIDRRFHNANAQLDRWVPAFDLFLEHAP